MLKLPIGCAEDCDGNKIEKPTAARAAQSFLAESRAEIFRSLVLTRIADLFSVDMRRIAVEPRQRSCCRLGIENVKVWIDLQRALEISLRLGRIAQPIVNHPSVKKDHGV